MTLPTTTDARGPRPAALAVTVLLATLALGACGSDDGDSGGGDSRSSTSPDADASSQGGEESGDFVTGTPEEWIAAVCPADQPFTVNEDSPEVRFGEGAHDGFYCAGQFTQGENFSYVEGARFATDPTLTERWSTEQDTTDEYLKSFAVGQVADDDWVVVWEDASTKKIVEPHLGPLAEFGFTIVLNDELQG